MGRVREQELYALADALYLPLKLNGMGDKLEGSTEVKMAHPDLAGMVLEFTMSIEQSAVDSEGLGVALFLKCMGRLCLLAYYDLISGEVTVAIIDGTLLIEREAGILTSKNIATFKDALDSLQLPAAAAYARGGEETVWKKIDV